jgi:hypothetical protein
MNNLINKALEKHEKVIVLIKQQAKIFLMLGKELKEIRDEELYKNLGNGGYDTFIQYLNNPEIGLRQSTAYLYIRIYEYYILKLQMTEEEIIKTPINRLMRLLPHVKKMENEKAIELIEQSAQLTNYDYDEELKERKLFSKRPIVYQCKECGKWVIEYHEKDICQCDDFFHLTNIDNIS